jgi:hypothetical protein
MATHTVHQPADPQSPLAEAREHNAALKDRPSPVDIECAISDVAYLTALAQWIENARLIIKGVDSARQRSPELDAALRAHDIRSAHFWQEEESAGLYLLLNNIRTSVGALAANREAAEAQHG